MFSVPTFDLLTDAGKQQFIEYVVNLSRKEINSYTPSFNNVTSTITDNLTNVVYQNTPYLDFNTEFPGISGVGQIAWNDTAGTLEFGLKGGNVTMPIGTRSVAMVKHADNTGLAKGKVVYVVGSDGANKNVRYALATSDTTSARTFGVVAETVSGGAKAFITTQGLLDNLNTIGLTEGAPIWVSPTTAGELTTTKPIAPDHLVLVGWCIRSHATTGVIFVHVVNGFELDELHDVQIISATNNQVIQYESATSLWKNKTLTIPTPVTVSDTPPASPSSNDLWYNSSNGKTYIYYDSFWVEVGNTGAVDPTTDSIIPAGMIMPTASSVQPTGWLYCYGQNEDRSVYSRLFTALGTTYGVGNGSTTFGLPDLRGRTIAGKDNMGGTTASRLTAAGSGITGTTLGSAGGTETHALTIAQLATHTHIQDAHDHTQTAHDHNTSWARTSGAGGTTSGTGVPPHNNAFAAWMPGLSNVAPAIQARTATNQNTGSGTAHLNTQPTMILNYLIKT